MEDIFRQYDHHVHSQHSLERVSRTPRRPFVPGPVKSGQVRVDPLSGLRDPIVHVNGHIRRRARRALESCQLQDHLLPSAIHHAKMVEGDGGNLRGGTERDVGLSDDILHRRLQTVGQGSYQVSGSNVLQGRRVQCGRELVVSNPGE